MSPPTAEQVDAALAALTGTITEEKPDGDLARNMLRLRLVAEAKDRGVPWAVIGRTMGLGAKAAKREMKHLAAQTQRDLLVSRAPKAAPRRRQDPIPQDAVTAAVGRIIAAEGVTLVPSKPRPRPAKTKQAHHVRRRSR